MTEKRIGLKLLLIEDDKLDQMAFERFVKKDNLPYTYRIANSVKEVNEILPHHQFDIIVADYNLGDGTVFDVFNLMKKIPVIIITGAGGEDIAVQAMREGAYDYLIKDLEYNHLKVLPVIVENAIKHQKVQQELDILSQAVKSTKDSVYITDMNDHIIFVNDSFVETYGYNRNEIVGKKSRVQLKITNRKKEREKAENADLNIQLKDEFFSVRKDGYQFPISLSQSTVEDKDGNKKAVVHVLRDITDRKKAEAEIKQLVIALREALAKVKTLSGLLPICASCKKIRDDKGYWNQIEQYIKAHAEVDFSHSICPECTKELYPDLIFEEK